MTEEWSTPKAIMGIDPGGTTGVCVYEFATQKHTTWMCDPPTAADRIKSRIWRDTLVVCERFIITPMTHKMTRQNDALELIGWTRYTCMEIGARFELQPPADAKKMRIPPGWHTPGADHADMASRHAVLGLLRLVATEYDRLWA